jgi:hypothetical protein
MSVKSFIPEITSAQVDEAYTKDGVVVATLTPDYDGEAKSGNAVTIVGAALPTVQDYAANGRRFEADEIEATTVKILIDQEKIVPVRVDNIDKRQAAGSLDAFTNGAGKALAKDAEQYVIGKLVAEGTSVNVIGSAPVRSTGTAGRRPQAHAAAGRRRGPGRGPLPGHQLPVQGPPDR